MKAECRLDYIADRDVYVVVCETSEYTNEFDVESKDIIQLIMNFLNTIKKVEEQKRNVKSS